ncbi:MAG: PAS domain S-box protein [Desulfobacteraceae bacterium]|nr:PAS domain S-box protein [Desulfobacteraceae bacterium]
MSTHLKPTPFAKKKMTVKTMKELLSRQGDFSRLSQDILWDVSMGIFIIQDRCFIYVNPLFQTLSGYSLDELIGTDPMDYVHPDDREMVSESAIKSLKGGNSRYEYRLIRKDGQVLWVIEMVTSITHQGKRAVLGCSVDITERKQIEDKLLQSEEKYRSILENIENGYAETDLQGNFIFFNPALCKIQGYPKEELMRMNYRDLMDEENAIKIYEKYNKVFATGESEKEVQYEIITKSGVRRYLETSIVAIKDKAGRTVAFRGIVRDRSERREAEELIRQSEKRYRTIIEQMEDGYFETDLPGSFTFANEAECRNLGYPLEELIGMDSSKYTDKKNAKALRRLFVEVYNTGTSIKAYDFELTKKDGTKSFNEISASLIRNAEGEPVGFRGIARDVTERMRMEEQIRESEERYRTIIEEMEEWYFETDLTGNITFCNDIFADILGYHHKELTGLNFQTFINKDDSDSVTNLFKQVFTTGQPTKNFPYEFIRPDGSKLFAEFSIFPKWDKDAKVVGFRGIGHDITVRKSAEERIQYLATHDTLTGLPNRYMFSQLLTHALQAAQRYQRQFAVLFIDLDRFKIINDTLGHEAGDKLLQEISMRLTQSLRAVDVVARLGGDEFVILIEELSDLNQIEIVANKILSTVLKPVTLMNEECRVTASIGISVFPKDAQDEQSLMKNADLAMYLAKEEGKNNYQFYASDIQSKSLEALSIESNLRFAVERNELTLQYQAKVDFKTNTINGVEALLRWDSPVLGSVTPTQFIPVAEESGLIISIGKWVLRTACVQNVAWQREGLPPIRMAVNLSLRQLTDGFLVEDINKILLESGMEPNLLELEITESMVMHNPIRIIHVLEEIRKLGVHLAIDDFGTGYSSLAQLRNFPVDTLKVDRSFIRNITKDADDRAITEAIISMGKTLSLTVIAEGVETEEQMNFLKDHSCDEMQGFFFSKPVKPEQFAVLLREHEPFPKK